jgi:hypothetical protein
MKRLFIIVAVVFVGFAFYGCEEDCAMCHEVTTDADGNVIEEKDAVEYCGTELDEIEAEEPVTIGGLTTQWECE